MQLAVVSDSSSSSGALANVICHCCHFYGVYRLIIMFMYITHTPHWGLTMMSGAQVKILLIKC